MASCKTIGQKPYISQAFLEQTCPIVSLSQDTSIWDKLLKNGQHSVAIELIRNSRFTGNSEPIREFVKEMLGDLAIVDESYARQNPLTAMLTLILRNDTSEEWLREVAAEAYKSMQADLPEDKRDSQFEKAYVYLKDPTILLSHMLLISNAWKTSNPENKGYYGDQMAGLFNGSVSFDKGDTLTEEELQIIQLKEGPAPRFPISAALEKTGDHYLVTKWCASPALTVRGNRAEEIFIESRVAFQQAKISEFVSKLKETSPVLQEKFNKNETDLFALAVIGPVGVGKSTYIASFFEGQSVTAYSLDAFNELLKSPSSNNSDHHFEAFVLRSDIINEVSKVPAILIEGAYSEPWRFNNLLNRDAAGRELQIVDIVPSSAEFCVERFIEREGSKGTSRIDSVRKNAEDAIANQALRIKAAEEKGITYKLIQS